MTCDLLKEESDEINSEKSGDCSTTLLLPAIHCASPSPLSPAITHCASTVIDLNKNGSSTHNELKYFDLPDLRAIDSDSDTSSINNSSSINRYEIDFVSHIFLQTFEEGMLLTYSIFVVSFSHSTRKFLFQLLANFEPFADPFKYLFKCES